MMPYGGRYQLTETQAMVAKLPVLKGKCDAVTMMSYGFDPYLSSWSPYHGAVYAVLSSVAKIVAAGGDYRKIRFTFQEYFQRMTEDPTRWGQPFAALTWRIQCPDGISAFRPSAARTACPAPSMRRTERKSTFRPHWFPLLWMWPAKRRPLSPEFKKAGNKIVVFKIEKDAYDLPVYSQITEGYGKLFEDIKAGRIVSAYAVERHGMAEAVSKMAFGNHMGVKVERNVDPRDFFAPGWGDIVCEVPDGKVGELSISYTRDR